jgi:phage N-6-adenine-methyltransferase
VNRALLTSVKQDYGTPPEFYAALDADLCFTIDLAAHERNRKHVRFFSPKDNSLAQSWEGETGFLNPPYGRGVGQWIEKARDAAMHERAVVCMVLPARVGSKWWRRWVMSGDAAAGKLRSSSYVPESRMLWLRWEGLITGVQFHDSRLDFEGANDAGESAPFDTAVVLHASTNRPPPRCAADPTSRFFRWPR